MHTVQWQNAVIQQSIVSKRRFPRQRSTIGLLWGPTTFDECVATVHDAIAAGINLLDLAPRYGDGKAEEVVGAAFGGRLPDGVCVTSKCNLGEPPPDQIEGILRRLIEAGLKQRFGE